MTAALEAPPLVLRWYQEKCIQALFDWFATRDGDALAVLPTGSGKSAVLSAFIAQARENYPALRVVVLATRAELVKQNAKAASLFIPRSDIGIYSAGLNIKEIDKPVTVANIQSLAKKVYGMEPPDIIVCDEAQEIADQDAGLYRSYFKAVRMQNPNVKVVGFTATPYKLSSGRLDEGTNALFAGVAYEAPVLRLVQEGYLTRPTSPRTQLRIDTSDVSVRGDYVLKALAEAVDIEAITNAACDEMVARLADRKKWLIFTVTVEHARHVAEALQARGIAAGVVHGELSRDERAFRLQEFSNGNLRAIACAALLTVGYDEPAIDAVVLLRATKSPGLYAQMVGRGMRVHPDKQDCVCLDFCQNIETHGCIDALRVPDKKRKGEETGEAVVKLCPVCEAYQPAGVRVCANCLHEFPPPPVVMQSTASTAPITSDMVEKTWHDITSVEYFRHDAKPPKVTDTLRAVYRNGLRVVASEYICIEHQGFARTKADRWWRERSPESTTPLTIERALMLAEDLKTPVRIATLPQKDNPRYSEIVAYEWPEDVRKTAQLGLPRVCWSCGWFDALLSHCARWDGTPDADTHATGCPEWKDDEPALPF